MKNFKKLLVIGLVVIAGFGLTGCIPQGADETGDSSESGVEIPADWQTFSHSEPSYSLKHPPEWKAKASSNPTMGDLDFLNLSTAAEDFTLTDCSFGVKTWDSPMAGDMELAQSRATASETVVIDGVRADKYIYSPNDQYTSHSHFLEKDGYSFRISFGLRKNKPEEPCLDIVGKVLSSFSFSE